MEKTQPTSPQRLFLEEIILTIKTPKLYHSQKKQSIENTCIILSKLANNESIEEYFNYNEEDIFFFVNTFLKEVITNSVFQQDAVEILDYCSILLHYIEFFTRYYSHSDYGHVLFTYLIDIFDSDKPIYSCHLEPYEKFNELLKKNPVKFLSFDTGDDVDILISTSYNSDNCDWVRGKVRYIEEDENGELYYNIITADEKKSYQYRKDSLKVQKGGTMTPDWEWRMTLKEKDNVDVFDRGAWFPSTIMHVKRLEINGLLQVNYTIGFRLYINDCPDWRDYMKHWKKKSVQKDQYGNMYLGDLQFDESIPHYSKRIQKFQSCCKLQRLSSSVSLCIDDYYLYHYSSSGNDNDIEDNNPKEYDRTNMIIGRNYPSFRYCYAIALKNFYDRNGYDILLSLLTNESKEKTNSLNSSSISTPSSVFISANNPTASNNDTIYPALYTLINSIPYFHRDFFYEESEVIIAKCINYFNSADHKQMRTIRKETIELLIQLVTYNEQNKSTPDYAGLSKLFLLIIYKLIKVNVFDKRLLAIKILNDYINSMKYSKEQITQFIIDNSIIYEMFGPEGHMQFISKGIGIIEAMIKHNCFKEKDLDIIWTSIQKGDKETKLLIIRLMKDSITIMSHDILQMIIQKITTQSKESITAEEIDLLFNIAVQLSNGEEMKVIGLYMLDYLIKNVSINDEEKFKKINENIDKLMLKNEMYEDYIEVCLMELKKGTYGLNVIKYLQLIINSKNANCTEEKVMDKNQTIVKEINQESINDFMNDDNVNIGGNIVNTKELLNNDEVLPNFTPCGIEESKEKDKEKDKEKIHKKPIDNIPLNNAINSIMIINNLLLDLYQHIFIQFKQINFKSQTQPSIPNEHIKTELQILIDFIPTLLHYYPTFDSLTFLSSILLSEPKEPQLERCLFTFMKKNFESLETFNPTIFSLFTNNTIDYSSLSKDNQILAYEIFYEVFLSENFKLSNLSFYMRTQSENAISSYDIHCYTPPDKLIGFEYIWSLVFNSTANCIMNHGMEMLYSLYHANYFNELINRIHTQLSQHKEIKQMIALMTFIMKSCEKTEMSLIITHKSLLQQDKVVFYIISSQGRECFHLLYATTLYTLKALLCHKRNLTIDSICLSHKGTQWHSIDHIKSLHELGLHQGDEVCLTALVDNTQKPLVIQGHMTPEYEKILTSWFYIFSIDDEMNSASLADLTTTITGIKYSPDEYAIKKIMLEYDTESKGYLTITEFCKLYLDKAISEPHYIWHSLSLMGIRNDLKEINDKNILEFTPMQQLLRYTIANEDKWIMLLFEIVKQCNSREVYDFIFGLCTNKAIAKTISEGVINGDVVENKYRMIYALYIVKYLLLKDDVSIMKIGERDDNELMEMYPEFMIVKPVVNYLDLLIKENSHIVLFNFYINADYDDKSEIDQLLLEHLTKVIKIIITKQAAIQGFDMGSLFNKQLALLSSSSSNADGDNTTALVNESLMIKGFEFLMHLLVFKLSNITDIISSNKHKLSNLLMNGLINTNSSLKQKFGDNLITYTQLSERQSKPEIASFFFDCCFQIFHKLKTANNLDDLSFFFEYFTSMFESYSSDDHHLAFVNEITEEIKTNSKAIPQEILVGYIKILTKALRSSHLHHNDNNDTSPKQEIANNINDKNGILFNIIMNDIIFQMDNNQLTDLMIKYATKDYINFNEYSNEIKQSNTIKKETKASILQASFDYIVEIFKQIDNDEDIGLITHFFKLKTQYENSFITIKSLQRNKRKKNNHVGLINCGLTCYMNSVIQQLYFIDTFRNAILQSPIDSDNDIMFQLKKLFSYLDLSIRSAYDPKAFVSSFQALVNNGLNAIGQQDSEEFLSSLFDVIEKNIKHSQYKYIIDKTFIGKTCSMIVCSSCNHTSLSYDKFYNLSLEVANMSHLSQSLDKYISNETIDNFTCEGCKKKVQIKKRYLLSDLPNILIIHLKRFNINYETSLTEKLNSKLEFPLQLPIDKYCVEMAMESKESEEEIYRKKDECYCYNLIGVLIHRGTAEEGHYYSIVHDSKGKRWIKVNDNEISEFDIGKLGSECYGDYNGDNDDCYNDDNWLSANDNNNTHVNNDNFYEGSGNVMQNAYLLFYEKKRKSDIIILDTEHDWIDEDKERIIELNDNNYKEIKKKYDKDRLDYVPSNDDDEQKKKRYFYLEKTKELYHLSSYDSIEHLIPKEIFIEIIKDNFPLEKYCNYYDENYREFFLLVLNSIEMHIDTIDFTNHIPEWIDFILDVIFIYKKSITAKQLNILLKYLDANASYPNKIINFFANKTNPDELFINENTESIELLVTLLSEILQHTFKIPNTQPFNDSITIIVNIMRLFPMINCHFVNRIYPLYELFTFLAKSHLYWIKLFIENKFIKDIIVYIMGKESRFCYKYLAKNDYWDANRPNNMINVHRLFNFVHLIIKQTRFYKENRYISDPNATIASGNDEGDAIPVISLMDFKFFEEEDDILYMAYLNDFELYSDIIILMQSDSQELAIKLSFAVSELLHKSSNEEEIGKLFKLIFRLIRIDDGYQRERMHLFFGYQSIDFVQSNPVNDNHNYPLVGKRLNDKHGTWIKFCSYVRNHNSTIIKKIMSLNPKAQVKFLMQFLFIILPSDKGEGEGEEDNEQDKTIFIDYLINFKSLNYTKPNFLLYLIDYTSNLINTISSSIEDNELKASFKSLLAKLISKIASFPINTIYNNDIPDKIKYEEIKIECSGSGLYIFKTFYYTSVYPHDQAKLDLIKDTYPFINHEKISNSPSIAIISSSEREATDKDFYKKILSMLNHTVTRVIVKSDGADDIEYPLLTMTRYGLYNTKVNDCFIKMTIDYRQAAVLALESNATKIVNCNIPGREYKDILVLNKKDYYDGNNHMDDISINISMEWNALHKTKSKL